MVVKIKILPLLLATIPGISFFGIIPFITSCGSGQGSDNYEIINYASTQSEAYIKVAQYLYNTTPSSLHYINEMIPYLESTDILLSEEDNEVTYNIHHHITYNILLCGYSTDVEDSATSDILTFTLVKRVNENSALYAFNLD
jgi:hypothetical protein